MIAEGVRLRPLFMPGGDLELMGRTEAARALGVQVGNLTQLKGLPEPMVGHLVAGTFWLARDIRAFAEAKGLT